VSEQSTRQGWLVAASVAALVWAVLVHVSTSDGSLVQGVFCLGWMFLSRRAMGSEGLPRLKLGKRAAAREGLLGGGVGVGMVAASWGVKEICETSALALCMPVGTLTLRAAEVTTVALLGIGALIVPAEELFWHGAVHAALRPRVGKLASAGISTALLCLAYLLVGEWELALVALPTFLLWGLLAEWRANLVAAMASHIIWTLLVLVLSWTSIRAHP
jgi:membrane protease YdiL (CAAX protease family)